MLNAEAAEQALSPASSLRLHLLKHGRHESACEEHFDLRSDFSWLTLN